LEHLLPPSKSSAIVLTLLFRPLLNGCHDIEVVIRSKSWIPSLRPRMTGGAAGTELPVIPAEADPKGRAGGVEIHKHRGCRMRRAGTATPFLGPLWF